MKKLLSLLLASILVISVLFYANNYLLSYIHRNYHDKMDDIADYKKYQSIIMQEEAAKRRNTLLIYGSSEVGVKNSSDPFYPQNFFTDEKDGFQVDLIGRGYYQSLIHAMGFGALGKNLRSDKVVFIVSPQWFDSTGLTLDHLKVNFSEEQFYGFIFNKEISNKLKQEVAGRILKIVGNDSKMYEVRNLCSLVVNDNNLNKFVMLVENPYYRARMYLLGLRDGVQTYSIIRSSGKYFWQNETSHRVYINWAKEFNLFGNTPVNNSFGIDNTIYDLKFKNKTQELKKHIADIFDTTGPEYGDFKILLNTFKELGIHPLIVDLPLNGRWYDYCGYNAQKRRLYYDKINEIVKSYDFELLDMSDHEYDEHEFKDASHPELKGWVIIDEAIDKYYHQDEKNSG